MQRELKFRVFDNVDYMTTFTIDDVIQNKIVFTSDCPIMQYTGMKDKHENEIYEGDILSGGKYEYSVAFEHGSFFLYHTKLKDMGKPYRWGSMYRMLEMNFQVEVIGNIYQNTELIQEEDTNN
jgi:uncharacterized phage protein (TIGR01671 family)